jgi:hypothetical protein
MDLKDATRFLRATAVVGTGLSLLFAVLRASFE